MQLTEQDCSHQDALVYSINQCKVKLFKLFEKMCNMSFNVFDTYYNSYFTVYVKYYSTTQSYYHL